MAKALIVILIAIAATAAIAIYGIMTYNVIIVGIANSDFTIVKSDGLGQTFWSEKEQGWGVKIPSLIMVNGTWATSIALPKDVHTEADYINKEIKAILGGTSLYKEFGGGRYLPRISIVRSS